MILQAQIVSKQEKEVFLTKTYGLMCKNIFKMKLETTGKQV